MKTAIITGITGQDGSYLAELLIKKNYNVIGIVRNLNNASKSLIELGIKNIKLLEWDMLDEAKISKILNEIKPEEFYNLAAFSSGVGMFDDSIGIGEVNGLAVARILEALRQNSPHTHFCQASSSEIFGNVKESPQSEMTGFSPRSPYGAAKLYAHNMIQIYRKTYNIFACSAILYNHESPRRGLGFVTRKITHEACRIKMKLSNHLYLGNLDARRDWGYAGDYVHAMWLMLQHKIPDDFIVATGQTHSIRDVCEIVFGKLDLDYRDFVQADPNMVRPIESVQLVGNIEKAEKELGWRPELKFQEILSLMVDNDIQMVKTKNKL